MSDRFKVFQRLDETTFKQLKNHLHRFDDVETKYQGKHYQDLYINAFDGIRVENIQKAKGFCTIRMDFDVRSSVEPKAYPVIIAFYEVPISLLSDDQEKEFDNEREVFLKSEKSIKDKNIWFRKPSLEQDDVKIRCACSDYRFRFQYANKVSPDGRALYGGVDPYTRKTDTHPPVNPDHIPGYCKHIVNCLEYIQGKKLTLETNFDPKVWR